jgi:8-oxo-dGTP pyrophosphatase MutT (NUDIX family)
MSFFIHTASIHGGRVAKWRGAAWGRRNRRQCAALPIALFGADERPRILLVTTRRAGHWVIPKGWAEPELAPHALAAREAFEEAGVLGAAMETAIGAYRYRKRMRGGQRATCLVDVFAMRVAGFAAVWPEQGQRKARWFTPDEAAARVREPELAWLLRGFARTEPSPAA